MYVASHACVVSECQVRNSEFVSEINQRRRLPLQNTR